ncbi:hypothetical protein P4910_24525 [Pantoea stewartii]|uniref:hypothetical protein n=1 Tax=Pantoea stewartii TaxID=66269 RepID=UPI0023FA211D|nr:hypothetical protein [Pantoea stewartii]MDF7788615.1 hypothetical protein [Pantoea stewartii]
MGATSVFHIMTARAVTTIRQQIRSTEVFIIKDNHLFKNTNINMVGPGALISTKMSFPPVTDCLKGGICKNKLLVILQARQKTRLKAPYTQTAVGVHSLLMQRDDITYQPPGRQAHL